MAPLTRAEYDAALKRSGMGYDPNGFPPWDICTAWERTQIVILGIIGWGVFFPAMLFGGIYLIGMAIDGISIQQQQHDRCLKRATNGYEIQRCH